MNSFPKYLFLLTSIFVLCFSTNAEGEPDTQRFDDAGIFAIQFVDSKEGWAAGEMGVIWHTLDGGKNWERQASGVRASLKSIHFLNPYLGWVVGSEYHPGIGSVGVILLTTDGGLHWKKVLQNTFPALNIVRFQNNEIGFLAGAGTDAYPSGVFTTNDGGKSWQPLPGPATTVWLSGIFNPDSPPLLAGAWNRFANINQGKIIPQEESPKQSISIRSLFKSKRKVFGAGIGGLVLSMEKGSSNWARENITIPSEALRICDFNAAGGIENKVWIGGSPGSFLLHSPDEGKSWNTVKLPTRSTIHSLFFLNENQGWATADLGTILATSDGGKTWIVQRRGGQRSKVLILAPSTKAIQPELSNLLGYENNFLVTQVVFDAPPATKSNPKDAVKPDLLRYLFRHCGTATVETTSILPSLEGALVGTPQEAFQHWDNLLGTNSPELLSRKIVALIRSYQPDVLVVSEGENTPGLLDQILRHACLDAKQKSGDKDSFPDQINFLGLAPWKLSKIILTSPGKDSGIIFSTRSPLNSIETTPSEFCEPYRRLLLEKNQSPEKISFRSLAPIESPTKLMDLFSQAISGEDSRSIPLVHQITKEQEAAIRQSVMIRNLLDNPLNKNADPGIWISNTVSIAEKLPEAQGARVLGNLAKHLASQGHWALAKEVFQLVCIQFPASLEAAEAGKWLVFHDSSSEVRRRHEMGQFIALTHNEFGIPNENKKEKAPTPPGRIPIQSQGFQNFNPKIPNLPQIESKHQGEIQTLNWEKESIAWLKNALEKEKQLFGFGPLLEKDPRLFFSTQACRRNLGEIKGAQENLSDFLSTAPTGPWKNNALMENWLISRNGTSPKPVLMAKRSMTKPFLDGNLDDETWINVQKYTMKTSKNDILPGKETTVQMAYDPEYLFVAINAKDLTRDKDKTFGKILIQLDLDRDYTTCFEFQIDSNGKITNSCWGDESWQLRWFASIKKTETDWILEAAIPVSFLARAPLSPGKAWAGNFIRIKEGEETQSWSSQFGQESSSGLGLEHMGVIVFGNNDQLKSKDEIEPVGFKQNGKKK